MHSLLQHLPLYKLTEAFENKYPDVNAQMGRNGLLYHQDINLKEKIDFIGKDIPWQKIADRLRDAVANDHKLFKGQQVRKIQRNIPELQKHSQEKRKGNRPKL